MPSPSVRRILLHIAPVVGLSACGRQETDACLQVDPDATSCPAPEDVNPAELVLSCGSELVSIEGEGVLQEGSLAWGEGDTRDTSAPPEMMCCYPVVETRSDCVYGRPLVLGGTVVTAPATPGASGWDAAGCRPCLQGLDPATRAALAKAWTAAALDEHASVAAFSRVALELMALGAPGALVEATHRAALDEIRHARLGFALAAAYGGAPVGPGALPLGAAVPISQDLVAVAAAAAREGCVGETLSALLAAEAAAGATDPAVRAALQVIAQDEMRHAALAWRTVRWALDAGGAPARAAVAGVFAAALRDGVQGPEGPGDGDPKLLVAHGVIGVDLTRRVIASGLRDVVGPCGRALLSGRALPSAQDLRR